jgi:RNA polymerase sigma-70 factor, ECF subfamily
MVYTVLAGEGLLSTVSKIEATEALVTPFRRTAGGERAAFLSQVESNWQRLVSLARSVVGETEAEDAVQDGLLVAWRKLATLRDPEALPAWLTRIVVRVCLRRTRRRWQLLPIEAAPEPAVAADDRRGLDVERLLRALAPRQRAVMHLTVVEEMSDGEISRALGITPGSVRSHRRRARQRLQQALEDGTLHGGETS